jgi:hypothetical protein
MPYTLVKIGAAEGYFIMDWGSTSSGIDTMAFTVNRPRPSGTSGGKFKFDNFDFYGSWGTVSLSIQDMSHIQGNIRQAGILGADFLSLNAFTLDYTSGNVYRAMMDQLCPDSVLIAEGYKPVSSRGYFSNKNDSLNDACVYNVPTVPIRIGDVSAIAQLDPGYSDVKYPYSVNINKALFNTLQEAGIKLTEIPGEQTALTTCVAGVSEMVTPYKLQEGISFSITGMNNKPVVIHSNVILLLKETPQAAQSCGGIGTWKIPAAQVGASYFNEAKSMIFDPFSSRIWFGSGM